MTLPSRKALLVAVVVAIGVFVVFGVLAEVPWPGLRHLDATAPALGHAAAVRDSPLRLIMRVVTDLGSPLTVDIVTVVVAGWWAVARRWRYVVAVVVTRLGELGCESAVKALVGRPRPGLLPELTSESGASFPSGHSAGSAAVYGLVAVLLATSLRPGAARVLLALTSVLVLAVAASRVVLGVHYPTDVLGGLALGAAWAAAGLAVVVWADSPKSQVKST